MAGTGSAESSLERLLDAERELEAYLEERRMEAERIRAEARDYARSRTAEFEERVQAELEELAERVERETARTLAEVRARSRRRRELYGDSSPEALAPLVDLAVEEVVGTRSSTPGEAPG